MTDREKQFSTSDPSQISQAAAWFAIFTNLVAALLLAALHIWSPEFSPSWRMISEYALGHYGWMLSLMFLCSGVSCWALAVAIHSDIRTNAGKLGLFFLFISGTGGVLAAFFDVNRPVGHGVAGLLGVIGFPIGALLLSVALGRNEAWRSSRKGLLWLANLSWISVVLLIATLAIMIVQLRAANGGHLPQHAPKSLPSGVLPLAGWADRMIVLSNWAWVFLAAYRMIRAQRRVPMFSRVAFIFVLSLLGLCISTSAAPQDANTTHSALVRDGSHDFDFIYGKWKMPNHHLKKRLAGSDEWDDFITCDEGSPLPGGIGDIDYWKASFWKDFVGVTVRTYDPKTGLWRIYWVDNTFSGGVIQPPVVGKFEGNVGRFEGTDTFNGIPILVRFIWQVNPKASQVATKWEQKLNPKGLPIVARWEQAFSKDNGKTWETNWYNEFIHDDNCTPTP